MGFKDVMLGGRPDMTLLPGTDTSIAETGAMKFRLPKYLKDAKKALNAGSDVSNLGTFAPLKQAEATDLADIDEEAGYGANALYGAAGGDQAIAMRAMTDRAKEHRREQTGRQYVDAMAGLRDDVTGALQQKSANQMWQQDALNKLRAQVYDRSRQGGGLLGGLVSGAASVGAGFAAHCWIARALWGDDDPRVKTVRFWLILRALDSLFWKFFLLMYIRFGERIAEKVKKGGLTRWIASMVFGLILILAEAQDGIVSNSPVSAA